MSIEQAQAGSGTAEAGADPGDEAMPRVSELLRAEGLMEPDESGDDAAVGDLTRQPLAFPAARDLRLQNLARGDEGVLLALVDRAFRARELGEETGAPAQDEEFVPSHSDNVQATGFVEHLKLPHHVDFQAALGLVRRMRREIAGREGSDDREAAE